MVAVPAAPPLSVGALGVPGALDAVAPPRLRWAARGASVRGAAHVRAGTPNQDAVRWAGDEHTLVLAVSDGHGSAKCFRSDVGARLAVATATRVLSAALSAGVDVTDLVEIEAVAQRIVSDWTLAARADLRLFPVTAGETARLRAATGSEAAERSMRHPLLAYGATLCAVAITPGAILYLQLGDGDILTVAPDGRVRRPIPADDRLFGGETTSLCGPRAAQDVRVGFQRLRGAWDAPALILVSTDGYANSFKDERGFLQVGPDLLGMVRTEGLDAVGRCLPAWLDEASAQGSGDDVTVGVIYRENTQ